MNVYTCEPDGGVLGWIQAFPDEYPEEDERHGVFLLHSTIPGGDATPYNLGDTLTHEVGHYLGLYHTFQGGCHALWETERGDAVYDTPPQKDSCHGTCAELAARAQDSCAGVGESDETLPPYFGRDAFTNFMDYSVDACMSEFTPGQAQRLAGGDRAVQARADGERRWRWGRELRRTAVVVVVVVAAGAAAAGRMRGRNARELVVVPESRRLPAGDWLDVETHPRRSRT